MTPPRSGVEIRNFPRISDEKVLALVVAAAMGLFAALLLTSKHHSGTGCHPQHGCQDHPSQNTTKPRQNRLQSRSQAAKDKKAEVNQPLLKDQAAKHKK